MKIIENHDAQFMLLAGFIIAIGLVITTVILNSIMFERNIAVGAGNEPTKNDIINLIQITRDEVRAAYGNATNSSTSKTIQILNFNSQLQNFTDNLSTIYALQGEGVNMSLDKSNWNNSRYANFTDSGTANEATNWTVIESVKNVLKFELRNVSGSNFEVQVTNQTTGAFLWSMKLNGVNSIDIKNSSGYTNNYNVDFSYIDLLNVSWNNYKFVTNVGTNISNISFLNGQNAGGRYYVTGNTNYGKNFTRARDYVLNATVLLSTSKAVVNITIPVSVP